MCPADSERKWLVYASRTNASYFSTSPPWEPQTIAAGDRNILLMLPDGSPCRLNGGATLFRTNVFSWGPDVHRRRGNLLLGDGSAHITTDRKLNVQVSMQPEPVFNCYLPNGP